MKRKIGLLIVTILTLIFIPNRVMAADWTNALTCNSNGGFAPGSSITCTYKVTPPSYNAANGVVGEIEVSSNLTIESITKGNSVYQGDIENTRFDFYSLSSDATPKTSEFDVVKINIKLGNKESDNEYVKVKNISVVDKDFNEVALEEINTKIAIKNESKDTESNNEVKDEGKIEPSDNQGGNSESQANLSETPSNTTKKVNVKNPSTVDISITLIVTLIVLAIVGILVSKSKISKLKNK